MKKPQRARPVYTEACPLELTNAVMRLPSRPVPRTDTRDQKPRGADGELEEAVQDTPKAADSLRSPGPIGVVSEHVGNTSDHIGKHRGLSQEIAIYT